MSALLKKLCMTVAAFASAAASAGVHLQPSLQVFAEQRYDENVAVAQDQAALGQYGLTGLFMSKVSPRLGLRVTDPTLTVDSWYSLDFTLRNNRELRTSFDHRGMLSVDKRLTDRLTLDTDLRIWRVEDPTSLPRQGLARIQDPILYGNAMGALTFKATRRVDVRAGYRFEGARIENETMGIGLMHSPFADAWFRATPRHAFGLEYRMQYFLFELGNQPRIGGGADTAFAHNVSLGWKHRLTRRMDVAVHVGPTFYLPTDGSQSGVVPRLQAEIYRDGEFFDWTAKAGHDLVGASGFTKAVWADFASTQLEWRFWRPLRAFVAGSVYRNDDAPNVNWQSFDPAMVDLGFAVGAGVEWQALKNLSFTFSFDRYSALGAPEQGTSGIHVDEQNIASLRLNFRAF